MRAPLARCLTGRAVESLRAFYAELPSLPPAARGDMLVGMGYNFEFYDGLFALMAANVQLALDDSDYSRRYAAMQELLRPFASEFGLEAGRPLAKTHRELYAEFHRVVTGRSFPERYPADADNPWIAASRRWSRRMADALACPGAGASERARFSLGYHWAVEQLSIAEMSAMRDAWGKLGVKAAYLDSHCAVEADHASWAAKAAEAFADADDEVVRRAAAAHEADLAGFYEEQRAILAAPGRR